MAARSFPFSRALVSLQNLTEEQIQKLCQRSQYFRGLADFNPQGRAAFKTLNRHTWPAIVPRDVFFILIFHMLHLEGLDFMAFSLDEYFAAANYLLSDWLIREIFRLYLVGKIEVCQRKVWRWLCPLESTHCQILEEIAFDQLSLTNGGSILARLVNIFSWNNPIVARLERRIVSNTGVTQSDIWQLMSSQSGPVVAHRLNAKLRRYLRLRKYLQKQYLSKPCCYCEQPFDSLQFFHHPKPSIYFTPCCNSVLHIRCLTVLLFHSHALIPCPACRTRWLYEWGQPLTIYSSSGEAVWRETLRQDVRAKNIPPPHVFLHHIAQRPYTLLADLLANFVPDENEEIPPLVYLEDLNDVD